MDNFIIFVPFSLEKKFFFRNNRIYCPKKIQRFTYIIFVLWFILIHIGKKPGRIGSDFFWIFVNRWLFPSIQFLICLSGHQVLGKIQVFQNKIMMTSPLLQDGSKQSQISPKNYENGQIWCQKIIYTKNVCV